MVLAWIGALFIGISLGLLGSGGSILTVPVLVYLVGVPDKLAIAESLAIVGAISIVGAIPYALKKQVDWRNVVVFGIPGTVGTYFGAYLGHMVSGAFQLTLFASVMILAAWMMFKPQSQVSSHTHKRSVFKIALEGSLVGILTGLVGVGGGFLIIPALVLLGGLPMSLAVGTSLLIIAMKSFSGFYKYYQDLSSNFHIDWGLIALFAALGIAGSFVGASLSKRFSHDNLKRSFAGFLVVMGVYVLYTNAPKMLHAQDVKQQSLTSQKK